MRPGELSQGNSTHLTSRGAGLQLTRRYLEVHGYFVFFLGGRGGGGLWKPQRP